MKVEYHNSNHNGECNTCPSTQIGHTIIAFDGAKLISIVMEKVGYGTPLPPIVSAQIGDAIKAMEAIGAESCYIVRNIGHDDAYCCWSRTQVGKVAEI